MSTQDSDGIEEAVQGVTQVAMTAAARLGEQLARSREQHAREAQARSEQAGREYTARFTAEREAARSSLTAVHRPQWWDTAQAEDISKAYQTANAWKDVDPEAARSEQRIVEEVRNRFDVDLTRDSDPDPVAEALTRADRARSGAQEERGAARAETAQAVGLMAAADAADHRAEAATGQQEELPNWVEATERYHDNNIEAADEQGEQASGTQWAGDSRQPDRLHDDAHVAYDSAERRQSMAEGLDNIENKAAVDARVRSDVAQGRPATDATAAAPGRAPKARNTRGVTQPGRLVQRPSRSR